MAETPEDFSPAARAEQERMYHELRESLNDDPGESLCHGVPISEALEIAGALAPFATAASSVARTKIRETTKRQRIASEERQAIRRQEQPPTP